MAEEPVVIELTDSGVQFSTTVGLIYVFNLIVGTGALTMPAAFHSAGWLVSLVTIIVLAFTSYVTVTFMTEAMGIANAALRAEQQGQPEEYRNVSPGTVSESSPLLQDKGHEDSFEITHRVEMGKMAKLFFNKAGISLFNLCIIVYLYGDLSIYAVAVPKSLRDVACTYSGSGTNNSCNQTVGDKDPCWEGVDLNRDNAYRIFVAVFICLLGPFVFFNVQKTKYLQIVTTIARWLAFGLMITLTVIKLAQGKGQGKPLVGDVSGIPNLFGVCVYSFMCHHSLPSLVTPIRNKSRLNSVLGGDYVLILVFYAILSFTGVFTFAKVEDLYTLNFQPNECGRQAITHVKFFEYFLALFPVFTLSTNFPIIAITLRNNLQALLARPHYSQFVNRYLIALLGIVPPTIVAIITNQVDFLVGITGSYAGTAIQYVIPACLVLLGRRRVPELQARLGGEQLHCSPFRHKAWVYGVLVWSGLCVIFVTVNHIITRS
ncbi:transmembrane protein 104-like isoform X2 [Littorina saxatilis]|uniref:Amino acid transporter transmembrane domain-containing protein n=1 Tax=Littorina saxatilis TaxID=31220 RepID=A0AAN9GLT1_9CAEN